MASHPVDSERASTLACAIGLSEEMYQAALADDWGLVQALSPARDAVLREVFSAGTPESTSGEAADQIKRLLEINACLVDIAKGERDRHGKQSKRLKLAQRGARIYQHLST